MYRLRAPLLLVCCVVLAACHHATIDLGVTPSTETVHEPWANSWILGLVPPSIVETAGKCTSGVAKVETQRTFLNGLVGILTLGIYTPMEIKVTCAMGSSADAESPQADFTIDDEATAPRECSGVEAGRLGRTSLSALRNIRRPRCRRVFTVCSFISRICATSDPAMLWILPTV